MGWLTEANGGTGTLFPSSPKSGRPEDEGGVEGETDHGLNGDPDRALVTDFSEQGQEDENRDSEGHQRGDHRMLNLGGFLQGEET